MVEFSIRSARAGDENAIYRLLHGLADYEKLLARFHVTHADVKRDYLCAEPLIHAELGCEDGVPVGLATWFWTYAGFAARRGLYLEDFFVVPACRGKGYGRAMLAYLCGVAAKAGAVRVDWNVLDWNAPSIAFYESLGARKQEGGFYYRLDAEAMAKLADVRSGVSS